MTVVRWAGERADGTADDLAALAVDLARGAAEVVRAGTADHGPVFAKSDAVDLVTRVDRDTERWLVEQIGRSRPDDGVLGEEGGERPGRSGVRWVLDPIDGTVNFVLGLPQYAVSVAAQWQGRVVAGAVCNPATGELYRAGSAVARSSSSAAARRRCSVRARWRCPARSWAPDSATTGRAGAGRPRWSLRCWVGWPTSAGWEPPASICAPSQPVGWMRTSRPGSMCGTTPPAH